MLAPEQGQRGGPPLRRPGEIGRRTGLQQLPDQQQQDQRQQSARGRQACKYGAQLSGDSPDFRLTIHHAASRKRPDAAGKSTATAPVSAAFRITPSAPMTT